jgi:hypothetical protein
MHGARQHISRSPLADTVLTCSISSLVEIFFARLRMSATTTLTTSSIPRMMSIGFMPAAIDLAPSRTIT